MSPAPIQRPVFWPRKEKHSTRQRLEADFNVKRLDETASRHGVQTREERVGAVV